MGYLLNAGLKEGGVDVIQCWGCVQLWLESLQG
jgi:hypothetical protein